MRRVTIVASVPCTSARDAYQVLGDFQRYPELTGAVRSVTTNMHSDGSVSTVWEVNFRNGVLCWKEVDILDDEAQSIDFTQTEGDFHHFSGSWNVETHDEGCTISFRAEFDLGMPSLAFMIDPIAESQISSCRGWIGVLTCMFSSERGCEIG